MNVAYPDLNGFKVPPDREPSVVPLVGPSIAYTMNGSRNDTERLNAKKKYIKRAREVKGWGIGPMPEKPFLERFLSYNTYTPPSSPSMRMISHDPAATSSGQEANPAKPSAYKSIKFPVEREKLLYEPLVSI